MAINCWMLFAESVGVDGMTVMVMSVAAAGAIVMVIVAVWTISGGTDESVAWPTKVNVPAAVGVPESSPLVGPPSVKPGGSEPEIIEPVTGLVPPVLMN